MPDGLAGGLRLGMQFNESAALFFQMGAELGLLLLQGRPPLL